MTGPVTAVRLAIAGRGWTTVDIARQTGLSPGLVSAVIEQLVRTGELRAEPWGSGCPGQACGGCALAGQGCVVPRPGRPGRAQARCLSPGQIGLAQAPE